MPIFNDFSENGKLLSTREESLNQENFSRYKEEKGGAAVEGYMDAMADFIRDLDKILYNYSAHSYRENTPTKISKEMIEYFEAKQQFLELTKIILAPK